MKTKTIVLQQVLNFEVHPKTFSPRNWDDAKKTCKDLGKGWRLPTVAELHVIRLNHNKFKTLTDKSLWSSSEHASYGAWYVYFGTGIIYVNTKSATAYVRAVRSIK